MDKIPKSIPKAPVDVQKNDANSINTKKGRSGVRHNSKKVSSFNPVKLFIKGILKIKKSFSKSIRSRKVEPVATQNPMTELNQITRSPNKVTIVKPLKQSPDDSLADSHIDKGLTRYNRDLKESRKNEELGDIIEGGRYDMYCYKAINKIMEKREFDKKLIEGKESDEIHAILLEHEIISHKTSEKMKQYDVDLEGSPYW